MGFRVHDIEASLPGGGGDNGEAKGLYEVNWSPYHAASPHTDHTRDYPTPIAVFNSLINVFFNPFLHNVALQQQSFYCLLPLRRRRF